MLQSVCNIFQDFLLSFSSLPHFILYILNLFKSDKLDMTKREEYLSAGVPSSKSGEVVTNVSLFMDTQLDTGEFGLFTVSLNRKMRKKCFSYIHIHFLKNVMHIYR